MGAYLTKLLIAVVAIASFSYSQISKTYFKLYLPYDTATLYRVNSTIASADSLHFHKFTTNELNDTSSGLLYYSGAMKNLAVWQGAKFAALGGELGLYIPYLQSGNISIRNTLSSTGLEFGNGCTISSRDNLLLAYLNKIIGAHGINDSILNFEYGDIDYLKSDSGTLAVIKGIKTIRDSTNFTSNVTVTKNDTVRLYCGDISVSNTGTALKVVSSDTTKQVEVALCQNDANGLRRWGGYFVIDNGTCRLRWVSRTNNSDSTRLSINNNNGYVGFGILNPLAPVHVYRPSGTVNIYSQSDTIIAFVSTQQANGAVAFGSVSKNPVRIVVGNSTKAVFDTNGSTTVGSSTAGPSRFNVIGTLSSLASFVRDLATDVMLNIGADNDGAIISPSGVNRLRVYIKNIEHSIFDSTGFRCKSNAVIDSNLEVNIVNAKLGYKINDGDLISVYDTGSYPCTVFVNTTRYGVMTNRIVYSILNNTANVFIPQIAITLSSPGTVSVKIPAKLQAQLVNVDICKVVEGTTSEVAQMETAGDILITTLSNGPFAAGDFTFRPKTITVTLNNDQVN